MRIMQNAKFKMQNAKYETTGFIPAFGLIALVSGLVFTSACSPKAGQVMPGNPLNVAAIERIDVSETDGRSLLAIKTTGSVKGNYTIVKSAEPPKVVIEMPESEVGKFDGPIEVNDGTITRVDVSRMDGKGVRVEVNLVSLVEHEAKVAGDSLEVYFAKAAVEEKSDVKGEANVEAMAGGGTAPVEEAPRAEEGKIEEKAETPVEKVQEEAPAEKVEAPKKTLKVKDVKIKKVGRYTTAEIITDGEIVAYNAFSLKAPNRVVVDIENAREILKKEVRAVSPHIKGARLGRYNDKVRVVFDYKGDIKPYDVVKGKNRIVVFFGRKPTVTMARVEKPGIKVEERVPAEKPEAVVEVKPEVTPVAEAKAEEKVEEAPVVKVAEEVKPEAPEVKEEVKPAPKEEVKIEEKVEEAPKEKVYTGQKVTLEFKDADIKNIFRVIAEVSGYNMIIDPAVTGKLTLRLVNVPWDQALDILLETNNLGMKKVGNVIRVLPMAAIKKEEEEALAAKKAKEKLEDLVTKLIPISYAKATDMAAKLKGVMTDRGTATVDERTNTIILKDIQKSIEEAEKLVASLDTPTPQVVIEARIVEANTNFTRDLGIQWGTGYVADAAHGNPTGYYFPNSYNITAGGGGAFALNPPATGGVGPAGGVVGISFGSINNTLNLDLRLSALESQGWGKVISSPKIVTLDNKEASIQQGISIPFETTSAAGTQTTFVDANLNLTVTPHVTADGRLTLKIKASKNAPSLAFKGASGAPSIDKKEATTEILVKDGETTVIGGIYQITKGESETFTPFLGKIPVIGWLFKSKTTNETKTELLIFITPRIAREKPA
jgi:type IV pilus assembly protein PilQ